MTPNEEYALRERVEVLTEEVSMLRRELGIEVSKRSKLALMEAFNLSSMQAQILSILYEAKGRSILKESLLNALYCEREDGGPDSRSIISVVVYRIRKNIPQGSIISARREGAGYRLSPVGIEACSRAISERAAA